MTLSNAISAKSLKRVVRRGDSARFAIDLGKDREAIITEIAECAIAREIDLTSFVKSKIKGRRCISYNSYKANLLLRAVAKHITNRFRIRNPSRESIVDGVIESLIESTPMYIIRRDIKSFYETIPIDEVRKRLIYDTAIPRTTRHYIRSFFDTHCNGVTAGLPRGVGLSSTVVELAMERFDKEVRSLDGVYKYFRYSDDILIFTFVDPTGIEKALGEILPEPMTFNTEKFGTTSLVNKDKRSSSSKSIEYLGYKFKVLDYCDSNKLRKVEVTLSEKKVTKLKTRIVLALNEFIKTKNGNLLCERMEFLSGNYRLRRVGNSYVASNDFFLSGIYYSYRHCGLHTCNKTEEQTPPELMLVNNFYHNLIKNKRRHYRQHLLQSLNHHQMERLCKVSFPHGFSSKMSIKLRYDRLRSIKSVWQNAK